jgi:hypothetical protein
MLLMIAALGALCAAVNWAGLKWGEPRLLAVLAPIKIPTLHEVLRRTAGAIFSSLNVLSCASIFIMARTLRHLLKQGHIEMLQLVPGRFRPSALFYAISLRYLPLAFVALLVIYVSPDPRVNPFRQPPFLATGVQPLPGDMWPVYWAFFRQAGIFLFCPTNLFMDLATAFWLFNRLRVSYLTTLLAVILIGLVSPVILMYIDEVIVRAVAGRIAEGRGVFAHVAARLHDWPYKFGDVESIAQGVHYSVTALLSAAVAWLALANLDHRWDRTLASETRDPILLKPLD